VIAGTRASCEPPFFDVVRASIKLITAPEVSHELINLFIYADITDLHFIATLSTFAYISAQELFMDKR